MKSVYTRLFDEGGFSITQKIIISKCKSLLNEDSLNLLEIGSASGYLTYEFIKLGFTVDIVEPFDEIDLKVKKKVRNFFHGSIEDKSIQDKIKDKYDVLVCADVLEHLVHPESVLKFLKTKLTRNGVMIISIPNISFWDMRKQLFFKGNFDYQESGLLDKTHLRFYSLNGFLNFLTKQRYKIIELIPALARFPFEHSISRIPFVGKLIIKKFKNKIIWIKPNLTFYHYVVVAKNDL